MNNTNTNLIERAFQSRYSNPDAIETAVLVSRLKQVIEVIPIDALSIEIQDDGNNKFFIFEDNKKLVPDSILEEDSFFEEFNVIDEGRAVVSKEFSGDIEFIEEIIGSLETFINSFEMELVTEQQYKIYEINKRIATNMVEARFSEKVIDANGKIREIFIHSNEYEANLYAHQLEVYGAYVTEFNRLSKSSYSPFREEERGA